VGAARNFTRLLLVHLRLFSLEAYWRARGLIRGGVRVPPGRLRPFDSAIRGDQRFVLDRAAELGPVFKVVSDGRWSTCVVGLDRGRRLLTEHEAALPGITIELQPLFPGGALRGMDGEGHKAYRKVLLQAVQATPVADHQDEIRAAIVAGLETLAGESGARAVAGDAIRPALRTISGRIMLRLLYGLDPSSRRFEPVMRAFRSFGPDAPVYRMEQEHDRAFRELQVSMRELAHDIRRDPAGAPPTMLRQMVVSDVLDETALGNLINLFESSHFDVYSLWHWLLWYLVREPEIVARVRATEEGSGESARLLDAIVRETLRLNQSEVLLRRATEEIAFEGHLIPADSTVRVCLWESHKDPEVFPDPFRFEPGRFLERDYGISEYAPFGLDKRRCIGVDMVFGTSVHFVERFVRDYDWEIVADGPAIRGPFHWEPNPGFAVRLWRRAYSS
jgi:cytochrome P450